MKRYGLLALVALIAFPLMAQETEPDPAVQAAKEETAVVYDLGRFFGFVLRLEQEYDDLALNRDQMEELYDVVEYVAGASRIEADWAEETLDYLELDLLSPAQLMQVDMFAIARDESRVPGSGTGATGGSTGSGPILSYINGGAFNPIVEETKTTGQDFMELRALLKAELGR